MAIQDKFKHRMYFDKAEVRTEGDGSDGLPDIRGHAIVYDVIGDGGWFTEQIVRGAASKDLRSNPDVVSLLNHDVSLLLGRTPDTLVLAEDDVGLVSHTKPIDSSVARNVVNWIDKKAISQMSFGFYVVDEEVILDNEKPPHFKVKEIKLFDTSVVTFPFYKQTDVWLERSFTGRMALEERLKRHTATEKEALDLVAEAERLYRMRELELFEATVA